MRRDQQWRANIRRDLDEAMAGDPHYAPHKVVRRVVNGVEVEPSALTAAFGRPDPVTYLPRPDEHAQMCRETAAYVHVAMRHAEAQAIVAAWRAEEDI